MSIVLLWNASVIHSSGEICENKNILIQNGKIESVTDYTEGMSLPEADESLCCRGLFVTPGLVNLHSHAAMNIFKGIAEDVSDEAWFNEKIWPYESNMLDQDIYIGTRLAIAEMLNNGITAFADHYFGEEQVLRAVLGTGIRADIAPTIFAAASGFFERLTTVTDFISNNRNISSRVNLRFGPHSPYTCPPPFLDEVVKAAKSLKTGLHLHISETEAQVRQSLEKTDKTPFKICYEAGCFEEHCLVAHGLWAEDADIKYLGENTWFAFCSKTYMKLAMGSGGAYRNKKSLRFSFGTDGAASSNSLNIMEQARTFALLGKYLENDPTTYKIPYVWEHLMDGHKALSFPTGHIEPGFDADLVIWDLNRPNTWPVYNPLTAILYSADASNVRYTMVQGKFLKYDGRLITINEEELLKDVSEAHKELLVRGKGKAMVNY